MSLTYVIPDIHGRYDLLSEGLAAVDARAAGGAGTIVAIGDYVDKGPQSRQVIERLLPGADEGWKLVALKGNHDAMMVDALRDPSKMASWLAKG
ncbi:MAG TPA: metallophosphoesterase, partial [Bradyrhizobium sp.]|nr:metallophosphoesterase [Bradyrhizobium sp.]